MADVLTEEEHKEKADAFFNADGFAGETPANDLLGVMKNFVTEYAKQLGDIREVLSETISEAWDSENDLIMLNMQPFDRDSIVGMIKTENVQMNKVLLALSVLVAEAKHMSRTAEFKFYGPLTMFGITSSSDSAGEDDDIGENNAKSGSKAEDDGTPKSDLFPGDGANMDAKEKRKLTSPEVRMGAFLPLLQDISNFAKRCHALVRAMVNQLACLLHDRQKMYITTFKMVQLDAVFEAMGEISRVLLTLDGIIVDNQEIMNSWNSYKRMMKYVRADPSKYSVDEQKLRTMESLMLNLDRFVVSGNMYTSLLEQDYGLPNGGQGAKALVSGNRILSQEFVEAINRLYARYKAGLNEVMETYEREKVAELFGIYALYRRLFRATVKVDSSLYKSLWELQLKVPIVLLFGRAVWFIAEFLMKHAPCDSSSIKPAFNKVVQTRKEILTTMDDQFTGKTEELYLQLCVWMVRMESELLASKEHNSGTLLNARSKLLLHGILLSNQIRNLVTVSIHLRLALGTSFRAGNIRSLAICVEMLKAIQYTYFRRMSMTSENISHMISQTTFTLKKIFVPVKQKLEQKSTDKSKINETKLDVLAGINLALSCMDLVPTSDRLVVMQLALSVAQIKSLLKQSYEDEVKYQMWKLNRLASWQASIRRNCDCSFLYWVTNLVPAFFKDIAANPNQVNRLQYLFAALRDAANMIGFSASLTKDDHWIAKSMIRGYHQEVLQHFHNTIINPIAREVETDLRLHIHSVVLQQANLRNNQVKDLSRFLEVKPINVFGQVIDIKERITHYLDMTFYNLNTVALHDGRIYAEMRNLAKEKYGLSMTEVHLPSSSHYIEALDVLEIMRNIHIFVARYNYNMNTQVFIERAVDQKHINVINVQHIANSIKTHGTAIMNTIVNFTYQFLCREFTIFGEFLFDDNIKSRLNKDLRYFRNEKDKLDNKYPYDRADKFNRDIRKLGQMPGTGQSHLDRFRMLISEIGNALGYVRMVRSGGLNHISNSIKFVPDLAHFGEFSGPLKGASIPDVTVEAGENLETVLSELGQNFAEGSEYFDVLVNIFRADFNSPLQGHLKNFHMIIPPLTVNFVEAIMVKKDKLHKKGGKSEVSFTDDGFALGCAYILKLLDTEVAFDSLHWFDSVNAHVQRKRDEMVKEFNSKRKHSEEDIEHHGLVQRRLDAIKLEFELLSYSFSGARIFFREVDAVPVVNADNAGGQAAAGDTPGASTETSSVSSSSSSPSTDHVVSAPPVPTAPPAFTPASDIPLAPDLDFLF